MPVEPLAADLLRWTCPNHCLDFGTTAELALADGMAGQEPAVEALRYGLRIQGHGQHVFVRALPATGRMNFVREVLESLALPGPPSPDLCFVHNFVQPDAPRLLSLPPGDGPALRERTEEMVRFIREDLQDLLGSERFLGATRDLEQKAAAELKALSAPIDTALKEAGLAVVSVETEDGASPLVVPVVNGEPQPFEHLDALSQQGHVDKVDLEQLRAKAQELTGRLRRLSTKAVRIQRRSQRAIQSLRGREVRALLGDAVADLRSRWAEAGPWLDELVDDVGHHLHLLDENPALATRYRINLLVTRPADAAPPVVIENVPTLQRLLGGVDIAGDPEGAAAPHLGIHQGSLVRAAGGVLIIDAREIYGEPGAWGALKRTLRTGRIELTPAEHGATTVRFAGVKPEAVPLRVKVVLIGDPAAYHFLDENDADFDQLFKVLVDMRDVLDRDRASVQLYGRVVARLVEQEDLPPFTAQAIGALAEHGARVAAEQGKLTARFGRIADIAREAAFHAHARQIAHVDREDVERAVLAGKQRADRPGRRYRERVAAGIMRVWTTGRRVGQVNGLAVMQAGPLVYGFPTRITATVGAGSRGAIHVEREAELSGQIHTKGFLTLGGLLRHLLRTEHPLVFDASLAHEQSYGGIDGDSASGAEFVCLISALTDLPVHQGIAMTGAIDQHGHILPIGAVNEKIEGFFDLCAEGGLDGSQGVVIPTANVGDLQLRRDVVEACRADRFHVWPVDEIDQALALFTGRPAGTRDAQGAWPPDAVLGMAVARAGALWRAGQREPPR